MLVFLTTDLLANYSDSSAGAGATGSGNYYSNNRSGPGGSRGVNGSSAVPANSGNCGPESISMSGSNPNAAPLIFLPSPQHHHHHHHQHQFVPQQGKDETSDLDLLFLPRSLIFKMTQLVEPISCHIYLELYFDI